MGMFLFVIAPIHVKFVLHQDTLALDFVQPALQQTNCQVLYNPILKEILSVSWFKGWEDKFSYGYHGDDGNAFCCSGTGQKYGYAGSSLFLGIMY